MVVTGGILRAIQYYHAIRQYLLARKSPYQAIVAFSGEHEYGGVKVLAVLDALPAGGSGAHPEVGAEDGLEPAWATELDDSGPAVGPYDGLPAPPALPAQEGLEVRLELREGLALGLCAVHGVGDVAQDVEAGGLGDSEHLGVLGALEVGPRPGGQRPGAAAPEVADRVARWETEGLDHSLQ